MNKRKCFVSRINSYNILIQQFDFRDCYWGFRFKLKNKSNFCTIYNRLDDDGINNYFCRIIAEFNFGQKVTNNFKNINLRKRKFWIFLDNSLYILFVDKNLKWSKNSQFLFELYSNFWSDRSFNFDLKYKHSEKNKKTTNLIKFDTFNNNNLLSTIYWLPNR